MMSSRERVRTAISHREPDRVPFDLGGTGCTSINENAYHRLIAALGLPSEHGIPVQLHTRIVFPSESFQQHFRCDVRPYFVPRNTQWRPTIVERQGYLEYKDEFSILRRMPREGGHYFDPCGSALAEARSVGEVKSHPWPRFAEQACLQGAPSEIRRLRDASCAAVVLAPVCAGLFEAGGLIMGHEPFLASLAADDGIACAVMDAMLEIKLRWLERVLPAMGPLVDVVAEFDDVSGQTGPLISPAMYRRLVKPRHGQLFQTIRRFCDKPIFLHCCGDVTPFLDGFIEMGVSIINPVQVSASHMEPRELKKRWGKDVTFWGGVDTHRVLPRGSPQEVVQEVKRRIEEMAAGGGYVCAAVHDIQSDTPAENIITMRAALDEFGQYR